MSDKIIKPAAIFALFLFGWSYASPGIDEETNLTDSVESRCAPDVKILCQGTSQSFCLNSFNPQGDSCADLEIFFKNLGIKLNFSCDKNHFWEYAGLGYSNKMSQIIPANVSLITDENEKLVSASIVLGNLSDTANLWIDPYRIGDIPVIPDSTRPLDYNLNLSRYKCLEKPRHTIITDREFSYPAGYMRKEPVLNYPELSAFHWGSSVKIPDAGSVKASAFIMNYWKLQKLPEYKYDDPEQIRKREILYNKWAKKHPPKKKKKRSKPPLLKLKPL